MGHPASRPSITSPPSTCRCPTAGTTSRTFRRRWLGRPVDHERGQDSRLGEHPGRGRRGQQLRRQDPGGGIRVDHPRHDQRDGDRRDQGQRLEQGESTISSPPTPRGSGGPRAGPRPPTSPPPASGSSPPRANSRDGDRGRDQLRHPAGHRHDRPAPADVREAYRQACRPSPNSTAGSRQGPRRSTTASPGSRSADSTSPTRSLILSTPRSTGHPTAAGRPPVVPNVPPTAHPAL